MAIDFPASPTLNQTFSSGNVNYVWDGTKWTAAVSGGIALDQITEGNTNATVTDTGSDGRFVVTTEGSERLRVDSSGRVGIGTTSPAKPLEVRSASGIGQIRVGRSDSSTFNYDIGRDNDASGFLYFYGNQTGATGFVFSGADGERARIDSSGRLLVGTSTSYGVPATIAGPAAALTTGNGAYAVLSVADTNSMATGVGGGIAFQGNDGVNGLVAFSQVQGFKENSTSGNFAGGLSFSTRLNGASLTERARIDSSGRLLVGTSSARSWSGVTNQFQIEGAATLVGQTVIANSADANGALIAFGKSRGTTLGSNTAVQSGDSLGKLHFVGADGSALIQAAAIDCQVDGTPGTNNMPGRIVFGTTASGASSPTERMRIDANGFVNIGAYTIPSSTPGMQLYGAGNLIFCKRSDTGEAISFFANSTTKVGNIVLGASSTTYNTSSDYRLKENVVPLAGATERLKQLPVHRFNFIVEPDKTVDGFLAHEAAEVVPECVTGEKDAVDDEGNPVYQGIDQSKLVPLLTAALQEAIGEIESLKARVAALEKPADPSTTNT